MSIMKVYIHFENDDSSIIRPAFTVAKNLTSTENVELVIQYFVDKYNSIHGTNTLDPACLELRNNDAERFQPFSSSLSEFVNNGDDLFLFHCPRRIRKNLPVPASSIAADLKVVPKTTTSSSSSTVQTAKQAVNEAEKLFIKKKYRQVREICEEQLKTGTKDSRIYNLLSKIYFANENYDLAVDFGEKSVNLLKNAANTSLSSLEIAFIRLQYAKSLHLSGQHEESDVEIDKFFTIFGGLENAIRNSNKTISKLAFEGYALHAECVFDSGKVSQAADIINQGLSFPGAEDQMCLLQSYAYFALKYDKYDDAIRALLKVVVIDNKNKRSLSLMGEALRSPSAVKIITSYIPLTSKQQAASAYALLATIAKDNGAIQTSIELMKLCVSINSTNVSYLLNLVHNLEINYDYTDAINLIIKFWKSSHFLSIIGDITCGSLVTAIESPNDIENAIAWLMHKEPNDNNTIIETEYAIIYNYNNSYPTDNDSYIDMTNMQEDFNNNTLDLLALAYTLVKLYYLSGNLDKLPKLVETIELIRRVSKKALHETTIRNENAYYNCIVQSLAIHTKNHGYPYPYVNILTSNSYKDLVNQKKVIYIVGDSHILPVAWNVIISNNQNYLLFPKLITGIKHWHLRNNNNFYPKIQFNNAMNSIPNNSQVLFVMGEIDCREGLLVALERDRYKNLHEGMINTIKIFITNLKTLINKKKIKVFIYLFICVC